MYFQVNDPRGSLTEIILRAIILKINLIRFREILIKDPILKIPQIFFINDQKDLRNKDY